MRNGILLVMILVIMGACNSKKEVDFIVVNATVYTVDEAFSKVESFAVLDGKILATGSAEDVTGRYKSERVIDAGGKFIYPGFNDAHCHFYGYGINLMQYADLRDTSGPEEIYEILKEHHDKFGGEWILGRSWDQNNWERTEFPDKSGLDELFPDIPVYLVRVDGHAGWCNSKALAIAGIDASSAVEGGMVVLQKGSPSGILLDNAMGLVSMHVPPVSAEQQKTGLLEAQKNCFAAGLTSVTDCGLDKRTVLLMEEMHGQGELKMRINAMLNPTEENFDYFFSNGPKVDERLVVRTLKLYADGALGSRGALLLGEYADSKGNKGIQIAPDSYYEKMCRLAFDNNFIVATHCIGDAANRLILDTYSRYLKGQNDRRWRIEHAQVVHPDDFDKFKQYSIIPSVQGTHATSDMNWAADRLGGDRMIGAYAYQSLLQQNGWLPNGTDFPVEHIEPLFTFNASVFRTNLGGEPSGGFQPEESLTREQALRSMTIWAAKASFEEDVKGSLEPGKMADFIVMDIDLMSATPQQVFSARIESTWIGGEQVFSVE
jgi:predicted amidohydrolase YtcJ